MLLLAFLGMNLEHVVNTKDGNGGFSGKLNRLNMTDRGLNNSGSKVVANLTILKVESITVTNAPNISLYKNILEIGNKQMKKSHVE
jgi:hypothetical protein